MVKKILITVDPEIPVPPIHYGGIERIVDILIMELAKRGYEIILISNPHSQCASASRKYGWPGLSSISKLDTLKNIYYLWRIYHKEQPDIVHSFSRLLYLYPILILSDAPVIQSYQRAISPKSTGLAAFFAGKQLNFTACGAHMFKNLPKPDRWKCIHNFTDTDYFVPNDDLNKTYLCFLGRIDDDKGAHEAIEVAQLSGKKLLIAGNIPKEHQNYFNQCVQPFLNDQIQYIGPVNDDAKRTLLQNATAMLFPIKWEEPFGIVMAESMACGTPVIGLNRGSVPEVIEHGVSGFIANNIAEMVDYVNRIDEIDRKNVRASAEKYFSSKHISSRYLDLYHNSLKY